MARAFAPLSIEIENETGDTASVRQAFARALSDRLISATSGA
ncbi:MAG: hypothetical protein WDN31_02490 [Hyphomicrobium sp.]